MRSSFITIGLLAFSSVVSAGPLKYKRQEGETPAGTTTAREGDGGSSLTTIESGPGDTTTVPGSSPSPAIPSPPSSIGGQDDECRPCTADGYRTYAAPSGKMCYCLGGSTEPWEWSDKRCVNDYVGLPNDEERPYFCLGSGSNPSSRACLSQCNFMLNTVNSANPCNSNLYNAAPVCASCVPGGAIHYQLDGKSPGGPYIQDESSMNTFMDGMKNWCAKPGRCLDLSTGGRISGIGGCPVVAQNSPNPGSRPGDSSTVSNGGSNSRTTVRGGNVGSSTSVPEKIVVTSSISTTDSEGRPTFSIQLATEDNPEFTANTGFAGARPTDNPDGSALSRLTLSMPLVLALLTLATAIIA